MGGSTSKMPSSPIQLKKNKYLTNSQKNSMYTTMERVVRMFNENSVNWWMAYSTLLGAVRHGDIIPWNDDMQLQMFENDADIVENIYLPKYNLTLQETSNGFILSDGINNVGVTVMRKSFDFVVVASQGRQYSQECYEYNFLFPLVQLKFGPFYLNAPQQPHEWLWRVYGTKYMEQDLVKPPSSQPNLFKPYTIKLDFRTKFPIKRKRFTTNKPNPQYIVPQLK